MPYTPSEEQPLLFRDIEALGASRKTLARLCDHQENILTRAINGQRDIPWLEFKAIREVVDDLLEIKMRLNGVPIDWSDVASVRKLLNDLRDERKNPPQPLTPAESTLISKFAKAPFEDLAIEMRMDRGDLLAQIESILARATRIAANEAARLPDTGQK